MTPLAVIADDLTGALDTAAPFAARGQRTLVATGPDRLAQALASHPDVIGVSTDSRDIDADAARESVRQTLAALPPGIAMVKKIDSRLKGNIVAELDAIQFTKALVIPAIPALGRRVSGGLLVGHGIDLPISVADRLGRHAGRAIIPDISSQADIAAALEAHSGALRVGARGMAEAMAAPMAKEAAQSLLDLVAPRMIIVIGSRDPISLAQVDRLLAGRPQTDLIPAPAGRPARPVDSGRAVSVIQAQGAMLSASPESVACGLAEALVAARPLEETLVLITGGATAQTVLRQLGIGVLEVLGEALPGMPVAQTEQFKLITKSGGFGAPDALLAIASRAVRAEG